MKKVVINSCFGGFSLSTEAVIAYAALKGLTVYPEQSGMCDTYWIIPPEQRTGYLCGDAWHTATKEQREFSNGLYASCTIDDRGLDRDDPLLVQVVETLGSEAASGKYASLQVVEIPADVQWHIEEYDGNEHVAENHRTWG